MVGFTDKSYTPLRSTDRGSSQRGGTERPGQRAPRGRGPFSQCGQHTKPPEERAEDSGIVFVLQPTRDLEINTNWLEW